MTHRLYTNEYNTNFVFQLSNNRIKGLYCTDESTERVLVIDGKLEDLQKLCSLMYENDLKKIQEVFPSFLTEEDMKNDCEREFKKVYDSARDALLRLSMVYSERGLDLYSNPDMKQMYDLFMSRA